MSLSCKEVMTKEECISHQKNFLDIESPKSKTEIQRFCSIAAQYKCCVPGLQLIYPNIQRLSTHNVVFTWSEDLEKEFQAMKNTTQEAVRLAPIDTKKKLKMDEMNKQ